MKTDTPFYLIFQACPHWFYELTGQPVPSGTIGFSSQVFKEVSKTADGIFISDNPEEPIWVVEIETNSDTDVLMRLMIESALMQREVVPRLVRGAVIYLGKVPALCSQWPWTPCYSLPELLKDLPEGHLLRHVLSPLCIDDKAELEQQAPKDYHAIHEHPDLQESQRRKLSDVLLDLLMQRFPDTTANQFRRMFTLRTTEEMKNTVLGREIMSWGKKEGLDEGWNKGLDEGWNKGLDEGWNKGLDEGWNKGLDEGWNKGLDEGWNKGKQATLIRLAKRCFQQLPLEAEALICKLNNQQLEDLTDAILDLGSLQELEAWLAKQEQR